ncbi:hypothetical protein BJX99DRAFT_238782 [Aspergillus californicus]
MASVRIQGAQFSQLHKHPLLPRCPDYFILNLNRHLQHQHLRHSSSGKSHKRPSSSAKPSGKRIPSTSSTSTSSPDAINPPPSTRPATLDIPSPVSSDAATADKLKRYVALGRAYLSFYKTGLKNVYHNYLASLPIRQGLGIQGYLPRAPPIAAFIKNDEKNKDSTKYRVKSTGLETKTDRSTFQLLHRAAYDVRRMIPFAMILVFCGELTPLAVLILGNSVTPYTCRVPRQTEKYRSKRMNAKRAAFSAHSAAERGSVSLPEAGSDEEMDVLVRFADLDRMRKLSDAEVLRACAVFGLARTHMRPEALVGQFYRRRLRDFGQYLSLDDVLISKSGGVKAMEAVEVRIAVEERGGYGVAAGKEGWEGERMERRWLEKWLERSN